MVTGSNEISSSKHNHEQHKISEHFLDSLRIGSDIEEWKNNYQCNRCKKQDIGPNQEITHLTVLVQEEQ